MSDQKHFSDVCKRLMKAINAPTEAALAEELGFKPAAFSNRKKRNALPHEEIEDLITARGLRREWVYQGQKPMYAEGEKLDQLQREYQEVMDQIKAISLHNEMLNALQPLIKGIVWRDKEAIEGWVEGVGQLTGPELQIVTAFRRGGPAVQAAMQLIAKSADEVSSSSVLPEQHFKGRVGQVIHGPQTVHGPLNIDQRKKR